MNSSRIFSWKQSSRAYSKRVLVKKTAVLYNSEVIYGCIPLV